MGGLPLGAPDLFLQAPLPRMRVAAGRGLSKLEREGVVVSLTRAGRGLAPAPGKGRLKSRVPLLPHPPANLQARAQRSSSFPF